METNFTQKNKTPNSRLTGLDWGVTKSVACSLTKNWILFQGDLEDLSAELKSADDKVKKSILETARLNEDIRREQERVLRVLCCLKVSI